MLSGIGWNAQMLSSRPILRRILTHRRYSTSNPIITPVDLDYDSYIPSNGNTKDGPLVILHGFLGSKRNWQSLCKAFVKDLNRPVYALDLRNHGSSPHAAPHTYPALASDVRHFLSSQRFTNVQLLGHSMGGKVAMTAVLEDAGTARGVVEKLLVADIAPNRGKISDEFEAYVRAMKDIGERGVKSRKEATEAMKAVEQDPSILAFLLTNLIPTEGGTLKFRLPVDLLLDFIPELGSFPFTPGERTCDLPTLFIKGAKSNYINARNLPEAEQFFPKMRLERLDAGHWVHAERPNEFKQLLLDFVGRKHN